jgi:beta-glucanase (GH16 family)
VAKSPKRCVSGECLPVRDLPGWKQVFTDDFLNSVPLGGFSGCDSNRHSCSGLPATVRTKWFAYSDGSKDSAGTGTYMPSRVMSIKNGLMNLHLHSENGSRLVSAPVPIIPGAVGSEGGLLYGRYAIRFRADRLVGYKTSFMLWPDSEVWPGDGEIDFPEADLAGTRWSTMFGFVHHQGATSGSDQDWHGSGVPYGDWHTAVIEWLPSRVSFLLDGRKIGTSTSRLPTTPMHWVLQTPTTESILASLSTSGDVQIDWVAVWKRA